MKNQQLWKKSAFVCLSGCEENKKHYVEDVSFLKAGSWPTCPVCGTNLVEDPIEIITSRVKDVARWIEDEKIDISDEKALNIYVYRSAAFLFKSAGVHSVRLFLMGIDVIMVFSIEEGNKVSFFDEWEERLKKRLS